MSPAEASGGAPRVSVVVCTSTASRAGLVRRGLEALRHQRVPPHEIVVVVDHNPAVLARLGAEAEGAGPPVTRVVANAGERGLSGARNTGIAAARGDVVAFIDDDAVAAPDWIARLVAAHAPADVVAVGGAVDPDVPPPRWFPAEFRWVVGCSYRGLPERPAAVRNVIGCNMSFRRDAFADGLRFDPRLGRTARGAAGCEETELCIRLARDRPGARIVYDPSARVRHHVDPVRWSGRYFLRRCHAEGLSKAVVTRAVGRGPALAAERRYVTRTLPAGVAGNLWRSLRRRDAGAAARAAAIVAGLVATAAGYVRGSVLARTPGSAWDPPC